MKSLWIMVVPCPNLQLHLLIFKNRFWLVIGIQNMARIKVTRAPHQSSQLDRENPEARNRKGTESGLLHTQLWEG